MRLALLLDIDGTLFDTLDIILDAMNAALEELGEPPLEGEELRPLIGMPVRRQMLILRGMTGKIIDEITDRYYRHFARLVEGKLRPYPGVRETLEALSNRPIGTATTRRQSVATLMLQVSGLEPYFTAITGGDQVLRPKPHPDLVLQAARAIGRRPAECVVVGDAPVDIRAGKAAGARTIAALYGYGDLGSLRRAAPDDEISEFSQLPEVLRKLEELDAP